MYFKNTGKEIVILLRGGDKSTQSRDIETAKQFGEGGRGKCVKLPFGTLPSISTAKRKSWPTLRSALEENDTELLLAVIGDIARSKGMAQIAKNLNLARESLYRSLSPDGNPSFSTVVKVLDTLGYQLSIKQKGPA